MIVGIVNCLFLLIFELNIKGIWVFLEVVCFLFKMKRMVVVFSDKVYGV